MNESFPPLASAEPPLPDFKDRSTGLMIFGILTILLGCLCALFVVMMLAAQAFSPVRGQSAEAPNILAAVLLYGGIGAVLIWLGIGSIKARRWARALLVVFSWSWLLIGVFATISAAIFIPKIMASLPSGPEGQPTPPPGTIGFITVVALLFLCLFFILLPGLWAFFYSSRHVKATCEARDSTVRWTDACPLPVLGLSVWVLITGPSMLVTPLLTGHCVMPFFGMFLVGWPAGIYSTVLGILWIWLAWMTYRLQPIGWWLVLVVMVLMVISHGITLAQHDIIEMYQLMGYPQVQIDQIQKLGLPHGMGWVAVITMIPFIGYLIFIKKYFRPTS